MKSLNNLLGKIIFVIRFTYMRSSIAQSFFNYTFAEKIVNKTTLAFIYSHLMVSQNQKSF